MKIPQTSQNDMNTDYEAPDRLEDVAYRTEETDYADEKEPVESFESEPENEILPVPVYDVSPAKERQIISFTSQRFGIGGIAPVQIAGSRRNRTRLVIQNEGTGAVYLSNEATLVSPNHSYKLNVMANYSLEFRHNDEVWVCTAAGDTATLNVFEEYVVEV